MHRHMSDIGQGRPDPAVSCTLRAATATAIGDLKALNLHPLKPRDEGVRRFFIIGPRTKTYTIKCDTYASGQR